MNKQTHLKNKRLVLISNGEPYAHVEHDNKIVEKKLAGGLTTGLDPLMQEEKGLWIAWGRGEADFQVVNDDNKVKVPNKNGYTLKRIELSDEERDGFYYGFSNEILWPICHSFITKANFNPHHWKMYKWVNQKYARAANEELRDDDLIWIHDYHLTLVPELIKNKKPNTKIGYFWHIPWPSWEAFRTIPWKDEILNQMLASDFIGFHTTNFVKNFMDCAEKLGAKLDRENNIIYKDGKKTKLAAVPLGIDYNRFSDIDHINLEKKAKELKKNYNSEKLILGVDRLDYTKGIIKRLKAIDQLFTKYPQYKGEVTLVQRISPSRTEVDEYKEMRKEINQKIGAINGRHQEKDWVPIRYFHQFAPQDKLLPYYKAADIALITPLVDGMNLVSKEYIATQENGQLILSEFAGAASQLKEALHVNPYHINQVAETLHQALQMSSEKSNTRFNKLKDNVKKYDIHWWRDNFLNKWLNTYGD